MGKPSRTYRRLFPRSYLNVGGLVRPFFFSIENQQERLARGVAGLLGIAGDLGRGQISLNEERRLWKWSARPYWEAPSDSPPMPRESV